MKQEPPGHLASQVSCRQEVRAILEDGSLIQHVRKELGKA